MKTEYETKREMRTSLHRRRRKKQPVQFSLVTNRTSQGFVQNGVDGIEQFSTALVSVP